MQSGLATKLSTRCCAALLAAVSLLVAASCSRDMAHAPERVPMDLEDLYAKVRDYRHDYERGLELIVSGEAVAGENLLMATSTRLRVAARTCAATPGCDMHLFDNSLGHVFMDRRDPLTVARDGTASSPPADPENAAPSPVTDVIPELGRTLTLLHGRDMADLIPWNDQVKAALHDWLTWKRPQLMDAYTNYQYLRDKIAPIYHSADLPEALLFAMMAKESGGKAHAYSSAGAAGAMQFMPLTALRYGLGSDDGFDTRLDPVAATRASAAYLNDQFGAFNNDLEKTLAAYNVGESKLRRLHRKHEGAEFWDPRMYGELPRETRRYVPQVLAAAWLFLHPDDYGLDFPEFETTSTVITLHEQLSLGELTICLADASKPEGWFRTLRNLNPRLDSTTRLPQGTQVEIPSMLGRAYAETCAGDTDLLRRAREVQDARYPERAQSAARQAKR
ncbi:MAG: transglycosylase SLT domain-containing protein [Acidobacteriota bacterium]|nr:transglycosylase SLT domain-containing protein [Acidobacteriota bacterium]